MAANHPALLERFIALQAEFNADINPSTKFQQYTLPGGENYREMLLTLPGKKVTPSPQEIENLAKTRYEGYHMKENDPPWERIAPDVQRLYREQAHEKIVAAENPSAFRSSHYDEPNILAHVRYNDRVIDGKKTLFVEEVQSDWHQKGKKQGYKEGEPQTIPSFTADQLKIHETEHQYVGTTPDGRQQVVGKGTVGDEDGAREYLTRYMNKMAAERNMSAVQAHHAKVPDAPFKTTWPELAMKRIIREAAEKGYDKVAWTPGSVQAERYDLSKHVKKIDYNPESGKLWGYDHNNNAVIDTRVGNEKLADYIGKDAAEELLSSQADKGWHRLEGTDLQVGGEGMKGFYDEILPATVNKLVKKHGGRVSQQTMKPSPEAKLESALSRGEYKPAVHVDVHTIDITPSLRAQAMKGFPLFTAGGVAATGVMGDLAAQDDYR